jgi:predicted DNA-binding protein with PD1-like motif
MHSQELRAGRTFGVRFDPGESFFPALQEFCDGRGIRCGYIPVFLAAFAEAEVVGACGKLEDPDAPVWSKVHLTNAEALGCGTIAYNHDTAQIVPHVCLTTQQREVADMAAEGYSSQQIADQLFLSVRTVSTH